MALYTRAEFAKLIGVIPQYVGTEIKRGKIFEEKKKIDDTHKINKEYIKSRRVNALEKKVKGFAEMPRDANSDIPESEIIEEVTARLSNPQPNRSNNATLKPITQDEKDYLEVIALEKRLKNEKLQGEINLNRIKVQKAAGEVIPTDMVKGTFLQHNKSIAVAYKIGNEKILNLFATSHDISKEKIAEMRQKMTEIVNECIKEAAKMTTKNVENIVQEYSMTRGRGEHD